jgi:hypothetical protein
MTWGPDAREVRGPDPGVDRVLAALLALLLPPAAGREDPAQDLLVQFHALGVALAAGDSVQRHRHAQDDLAHGQLLCRVRPVAPAGHAAGDSCRIGHSSTGSVSANGMSAAICSARS